MNYEGFRALSYNAADQKNAELMAPVYRNVPKDIPVIGTHVWPAQAAVHAGMKYVVNAIPDNWRWHCICRREACIRSSVIIPIWDTAF